jgi:YfiH family protein
MDNTALSLAALDASTSITLSAWDTSALPHGFMDRRGGVSRGAFASMNLARWVNDDPAAVDENWRRWRASYPGLTPACLRQVHGNAVWTVDGNHDGTRRAADGMVTAAPGVALCVFSADCVPILLADTARGLVGALHAGWRGTLANIAAAGVRAMAAIGARPAAIDAALGPAISVCCFEVDAALADRFAVAFPASRRHARPGRPGKAYLDLRPIIRDQLATAGLDPARIATVGPCTKCASDRYFSRRAIGGTVSGLQMSFIGMKP